MTITASPLAWPTGWKRTPESQQVSGRFSMQRSPAPGRSYAHRGEVSIAEATGRLLMELGMMGVHREDVILSTNLTLRLDGMPRSGQPEPRDPGACVYWPHPMTGKPLCMAIDRYSKVAQNIAALAATIEAMRTMERHGGAVVLEKAFTGFTALPAPIVAGAKRHWSDVLGVSLDRLPKVGEVAQAYRQLAAKHHPDRGGNPEQMAELNAARDEALKELAP